MTDTLGISEGKSSLDDIMWIYSTKTISVGEATLAASSATGTITLGPPGIYEITVFQSAGSAPTAGATIAITKTGGSPLFYLVPDPARIFCLTRRFRTTEDSLQIKIANGFGVQISYLIQQLF